MITVKDINKKYMVDGKDTLANRKINLSIPENKVFALLGPNGAGKTTLIKIICNLVSPDSGDILFDGVTIYKDQSVVKQQVGVLLESAKNVYQYLTVEETLRYFGYLNNLDGKTLSNRVKYLLDLFDLSYKSKAKVGTLSRGMQQMVAFMLALLKDPKILILDEPTLGLDIENSIRIKQLISELSHKKTIILTTHAMELAEELAENIAIINQGQIVKSTSLKQLKSNYSSTLESYEIVVRMEKKQVEQLQRHPGIQRLDHISDGLWEVVGDRSVLNYALKQEEIIELRKVTPDLKDIFIDIIN